MASGAGEFFAKNAVAISPHATNPISPTPQAVWVGGAGNITGRLMGDGADVVISGITAGTLLKMRFQYIRATGTTATLMTALS